MPTGEKGYVIKRCRRVRLVLCSCIICVSYPHTEYVYGYIVQCTILFGSCVPRTGVFFADINTRGYNNILIQTKFYNLLCDSVHLRENISFSVVKGHHFYALS